MNRIIRRIAIYSNSWRRLFTKKILARSGPTMKGNLITDTGQIHLIRAYREYLAHHVCPLHLNRLVYGRMVDLVSVYVGKYFACSLSIRFNQHLNEYTKVPWWVFPMAPLIAHSLESIPIYLFVFLFSFGYTATVWRHFQQNTHRSLLSHARRIQPMRRCFRQHQLTDCKILS